MTFLNNLPQKIAISALILAASLISTQPAIAYTLDNQLRHPFPADFQQRIEAIEKIHGLKFHITTANYDRSKVFLFSGADAADKIQESLEMLPNYDADKDTILVWLQDINEKSKGSFGVKPSGLLKSYSIERGVIDDITSASIKPFMPGNPPKALLQLATNLDSKISEIDRNRGILTELGKAIAAAFLIGSAAFFAWIGIETLKERQADRQEIIEKTNKLKLKIDEWNSCYDSELKELPSILFDLQLASEESDLEGFQKTFFDLVQKYTQNTVDFCHAIKVGEVKNELPDVDGFILTELRLKKEIGDLLLHVENEYGDWLRSYNDPDRFNLVYPQKPVELMGKTFNFKLPSDIPTTHTLSAVPRRFEWHECLERLEKDIDRQFNEYCSSSSYSSDSGSSSYSSDSGGSDYSSDSGGCDY
jgi:hypothetical protein